MTSSVLLDLETVERDVMMYISRKNGNMCTIFEIYSDIIEEREIKNPEILSDLKIKLNIVMSQLDSKQKNVSVIKNGNTYLVGYNMNDKCINVQEKVNNHERDSNEKLDFDTSNMAKSMFEYIVDNNINYTINSDCNGESLLFIGVTLNDIERINTLVSKYSMSFYSPNKNGKSVIDLIPNSSSQMFKFCMKENHQDICKLKEKINELDKTNSLLLYKLEDTTKKIQTLTDNIVIIKQKYQDRIITDIIYWVVMIFAIYLYK